MDPKTKTTTAVAASEPKATPFYATREFTDAGTGRAFEKNAELVGIDAGTAENYRVAGLATSEKPDAEAAA
ncbi:hypothetical protein [Sphingomonas sp. Leaf62]|uniref:hypothetical protein n=1 Tax=Sphingomonas sp. Leaf62 TaxID=1736228 RepID=UPI00070230A2|nr:hypothetical protein [Sphingomonas sp. Leaf62]KQN77877.1 hypothetical protein ASE91_14260 [Sphingomonas sp. Leaf62]